VSTFLEVWPRIRHSGVAYQALIALENFQRGHEAGRLDSMWDGDEDLERFLVFVETAPDLSRKDEIFERVRLCALSCEIRDPIKEVCTREPSYHSLIPTRPPTPMAAFLSATPLVDDPETARNWLLQLDRLLDAFGRESPEPNFDIHEDIEGFIDFFDTAPDFWRSDDELFERMRCKALSCQYPRPIHAPRRERTSSPKGGFITAFLETWPHINDPERAMDDLVMLRSYFGEHGHGSPNPVVDAPDDLEDFVAFFETAPAHWHADEQLFEQVRLGILTCPIAQ